MSNDPIRPLHDVWLRPRRVFRELAAAPVGRTDLVLGAAQGIVGFLGYCRARNAGATYGLAQIFGAATLAGAVLGILSLYVMGTIYSRLAGGAALPGATSIPALRRRMIHVLAYGAVPMAVSLGIWVLTALLAGDATFLSAPRPEDEGFVAILLTAQFISYLLLMIWSVVLQVMGFSEVLNVTVGKAAGVWVLGQLAGVLAALFLAVIVITLIPGS